MLSVRCVALVVCLAACGSSSPKATSRDAGAKASAAAPTATGLPDECAVLITKYHACIDKMPEAQRAQMTKIFDEQVKVWTDALAKKPEQHNIIAEICARDQDGLKKTTEKLGCVW